MRYDQTTTKHDRDEAAKFCLAINAQKTNFIKDKQKEQGMAACALGILIWCIPTYRGIQDA